MNANSKDFIYVSPADQKRYDEVQEYIDRAQKKKRMREEMKRHKLEFERMMNVGVGAGVGADGDRDDEQGGVYDPEGGPPG